MGVRLQIHIEDSLFSKNILIDSGFEGFFAFLKILALSIPTSNCKALFTSVHHFWGFMFKDETKICSIDNKSVEKNKMLTCLLGGGKP